MIDDNRAANEEQGSEESADEDVIPAVEIRVPTLAEDLADLEKLNLMRAVMLQLQGGKHPYASTDALLKRRMSFDAAEFQGPYVVRLACTLMMIFVCCSIFWSLLWLITSALNFTYVARLMSTGLATLFAAMAGVAIFHPSSVPDEKKLKEAIEERLHQMRSEIEEATLQRNKVQTESTAEEPKPAQENKSSDKIADNTLTPDSQKQDTETPGADSAPAQPETEPPADNIESAQSEPAMQPPKAADSEAPGAPPQQSTTDRATANDQQQTQKDTNEQEKTNANTKDN